MNAIKRSLLSAGVSLMLVGGSFGLSAPAFAQALNISPDGPSGIVVTPAEQFNSGIQNQALGHDFTNPGIGTVNSSIGSGGAASGSAATGLGSYTSGNFQGGIGEGLGNQQWQVSSDDQSANGGDNPNSPAS
ncbi:MAG: hypothetical protein IT305_05525 [Chloroflexi bacterium]|nr:hypothetical protein [Chloroflexota bacterium]